MGDLYCRIGKDGREGGREGGGVKRCVVCTVLTLTAPRTCLNSLLAPRVFSCDAASA